VENARCLICHHAEEQRVGPSWAAIAERYGDDSEALATLTARARSGGSGVWGPAPMPPVTDAQLDDAQLASVIGWILER
jgi:cytochrome c